MRVVCIGRRRSDVEDAECARYASAVSEELSVGQTYRVYGQLSMGGTGCLLYLVDPLYRGTPAPPIWYPASLFSVSDGELPTSWIFARHPVGVIGDTSTAIWGYPELATDPEHYVGLIEREEQALQVYMRRKREIDAEDQQRGEWAEGQS